MTTSYRIVSLKEAREKGYPQVERYFLDDDDDWTAGLWRFEDDDVVEFIAADGGEPEDYSFYRDLSWIPLALQNAYRLGRETEQRINGDIAHL